MVILHAFLVHAESAKHFKIPGSQGPAKAVLREDGVLRGCPIELNAHLSANKAEHKVSKPYRIKLSETLR
jgi:hypothetical protein